METLDILSFIEEIKKRNAIWDCTYVGYTNRKERDNAWEELCQLFCSDYDELRTSDKNEINQQLRRRWRSLRDCYAREIKIVKRNNVGNFKRRYMYYDYLKFLGDLTDLRINLKKNQNEEESPELLPECSVIIHSVESLDEEFNKKTNENIDNEQDANMKTELLQILTEEKQSATNENEELSSPSEESASKDDKEWKPPTSKRLRSSSQAFIKRKVPKSDDSVVMVPKCNDSVVRIIEDRSSNSSRFDAANDCNDTDKLFLLSLLDDFKKISEDNKADAKCEILQVLKKFKACNAAQPHKKFRFK